MNRHAVFRSGHAKNTLSPVWNEIIVSIDRLVQGLHDIPFLMKLYDHERSGNHTPMGSVEVTVDQIIANEASFELSVDGKVGNYGFVSVNYAEILS
mmetsp:Transcript_15524/g.22920  ORF Transcript_15524/g.22920 Transcript_15524/m.22920 type:complete len:96 (+) Transcript_15524:41-328(+)